MAKKKTRVPVSKKEGNKYDKIYQENLRELTPSLLHIIGLKGYRLEPLHQIKLQTTLEKEPDFFQKLFDDRSPEGRILHIELEGQDLESMDWRMAEYIGIGGNIHRMEIEQHLIYYGPKKPKHITGEIRHSFHTYRYKVHWLGDSSYRVFLGSDKPGAVIFGIFANMENKTPEEIVGLIIKRLLELKGDAKAIRKFIRQLVMLSKKRNLQYITIKKINEMIEYPEYIDDILYIQGEEKGIKKGMEKGIKKGMEKGLEKGMEKGSSIKEIIAIRNMSEKGFKVGMIADLLEIKPARVSNIIGQLGKAGEIAELLKKKDLTSGAIAEKLKVSPYLVDLLKMEKG